MAVQIGGTLTARPVALPKSDETFSSRVVNYIDGVTIGGVAKTKLYTEVNTNLKVGDKIFIINGNYCNCTLNQQYIYNEYSTGYTILDIDRCAITIDRPFDNTLPKNQADFNDESKFIKTFVVNSAREVDYYDYAMTNQQGESSINPKFEFEISGGKIKDMIFNNTGNTISSPNGNILPNTFFSYVLQSGSWNKYPLTGAQIFTELASKKIYIMEPFELNWNSQQINCEKTKVYYLDSSDGLIKLDVSYEDVFVSKSNFRFGNFKGGTWNDGVFGKKTDEVTDKKTYWEGANWRNGIFYNSDWLTGRMQSKSDKIKQQSYYGELDEYGLIKQTTDFSNNKTFGYNYVLESDIKKATVDNANVYNTKFGPIGTTASVRNEYYQSLGNNFDVSIGNGLYYDCDFDYVNISNGVFEVSDIDNSNIRNARILDTNVNESIVTSTEYDSYGSVKVIDYDKQFYRIDDAGLKRIAIVHKFYMSDEDFLKIEEGDSIYFNRFISNHMGVNSLFDKEYYIGLGPEANTNGFNHGYLDNEHEVIVELKPKSKNEYKYVLDSGATSFNVLTASNDKFYNSLDLTFIIAPVEPTIGTTYSVTTSQNTYDNIYNNIILNNEDYKSQIISYEAGRIQISKIDKSLIKDSTWTRGAKELHEDYIIKPSEDIIYSNLAVMSITGSYGSYQLSVELKYSDSRDLWRNENLDIDEIVYMNNVTYDEGTFSYDLSGVYNVSTYSYGTSSRTVQLQEYGSGTQLNIGVTFSLTGTYSYRNTPFVSGTLNDTKIDNTIIKGGSFRRAFFNNSKFDNDTLNTTDTLLLKVNINKLKVYRSMLSEEDNLVIGKSFITESVMKGVTVTDSLVYNCSGTDMTWNGGIFYGSEWRSGVFNGGIFNAEAIIGVSTFTTKELQNTLGWYSDNLNTPSGYAFWRDGNFNNGEMLKTWWYDGIFNNGEMYSSIFNDGVWNNGEFGKANLTNTDTQFWRGEWYDGTFIKGIFGYGTSVPSPYISNWYNGEFRDGEFVGATLSTNSEPAGNTIWYDGTFNGGRFSGSARWKDGIFNGGKFSSFYGGGTGSSASNYSWEDGLFNGGEFGDIYAESVSTWNSSWYDGIFEGGLFQGKVWNNGIFTGGDFRGMTANGASSSSYNENSKMYAVKHPENFVLSYSSEVSTKNWYGMWRDGIVIDNFDDLTNKSDLRFRKIRNFKGQRKPTIVFENTLWVKGTFSSTSAQMKNSVWLDGSFNRGQFIESSFNPYVPRWDFSLDGGSSSTVNCGVYQHSLTSSCVWNNGVFDNSDFHLSTWNNGRFLYGTMSNAEFNNGVSNYMNAYNIIWNGGRWRNGNWYGANNNVVETMHLNGTLGPPGTVVWIAKTSGNADGIVHQMRRHNSTHCFMWNIFNENSEYASTSTYINANNEYSDLNILAFGDLINDPPGIFASSYNVEFSNYPAYGYPVGAMSVIADDGFVTYGLTASLYIDNQYVTAHFGNGAFKNGVWENGVWNNGPRDVFWDNTEEVKYFDTVTYYQLSRDVWQIVLTGSDNNSDINSFTTGDEVSIGNIVLIDINGDRKLIKDKFKIVNIDVNSNYLYVNTVINFPIRRIEIDSDKHKISVTKNIWLSGLFLNGKFSGVWNNGYFKGYPRITEIYDTNWIDGTFDGGYFSASVATYSDSITGVSNFASYSTSLIESFKFYDNRQDNDKYLSWLDLNYGVDDLVALVKSNSIFSLESQKFNKARTTFDILDSESDFKTDNGDFKLKLGRKFTRHQYVLHENFDFGVSQYNTDEEWASVNGWQFEETWGSPYTGDYNVVDFNNGLTISNGSLEILPNSTFNTLRNVNLTVEPLRYFEYEVDLITYSGTPAFIDFYTPDFFGSGDGNFLNDGLGVNRKYFFNLSTGFTPFLHFGPNTLSAKLGDFKITELDMIPFPKYYLTETEIDQSIKVPYTAIAPFIDYSDTDFPFIDNVSFEFHSDAVVPTPPTPPIYNPPQKGL